MVFSDDKDCSASPHASDDFSLFLRQLLHRSSSSSSSPPATSLPPALAHSGNQNVGFSSADAGGVHDGFLRFPGRSVVKFSDPDRLAVDRVSSAAQTCDVPIAGFSYWSNAPAGGCSNLTPSSAAPVESDSLTAGSVQLRSAENDTDEYDCESEDGPEAGGQEAQPKQNLPRNLSKRSRAAEVHNLSEKRRRSRINEKMKALQNLIPNSNKTDKASMLDEAIEYLKQLQLQVQMLSMRNGLILHPMCLPGFNGALNPVQLSQLGLNFGDRAGSMQTSIANTLPSDPPHHCDPSTRPSLDNLSGMINTEAPYPLQTPLPNQLSSFHLLTASQNICREETLSQRQLAIKDSQPNPLEFDSEPSTPMPIPVSKFSSQPSYMKDGTQAVLQGSSRDHIRLLSSNLDGLYPEITAHNDSLTTSLSGAMDQKSDIFRA